MLFGFFCAYSIMALVTGIIVLLINITQLPNIRRELRKKELPLLSLSMESIVLVFTSIVLGIAWPYTLKKLIT